MSRILFSASLAIGVAFSAAAFAQTSPMASSACNRTAAIASQTGSPTTNMAATSSDSGNKSTGASSASIGTGMTDKVGVNSPCVPGATGNSATGALPAPSTTP